MSPPAPQGPPPAAAACPLCPWAPTRNFPRVRSLGPDRRPARAIRALAVSQDTGQVSSRSSARPSPRPLTYLPGGDAVRAGHLLSPAALRCDSRRGWGRGLTKPRPPESSSRRRGRGLTTRPRPSHSLLCRRRGRGLAPRSRPLPSLLSRPGGADEGEKGVSCPLQTNLAYLCGLAR